MLIWYLSKVVYKEESSSDDDDYIQNKGRQKEIKKELKPKLAKTRNAVNETANTSIESQPVINVPPKSFEENLEKASANKPEEKKVAEEKEKNGEVPRRYKKPKRRNKRMEEVVVKSSKLRSKPKGKNVIKIITKRITAKTRFYSLRFSMLCRV